MQNKLSFRHSERGERQEVSWKKMEFVVSEGFSLILGIV